MVPPALQESRGRGTEEKRAKRQQENSQEGNTHTLVFERERQHEYFSSCISSPPPFSLLPSPPSPPSSPLLPPPSSRLSQTGAAFLPAVDSDEEDEIIELTAGKCSVKPSNSAPREHPFTPMVNRYMHACQSNSTFCLIHIHNYDPGSRSYTKVYKVIKSYTKVYKVIQTVSHQESN